jgi:serine/arginine repetitive matrix protein 2
MILQALERLRGHSRPNPNASDRAGDDWLSTAFSETQDGSSRMSTAASIAGAQSVRSNFTTTTTSSGLQDSPSVASFTSFTKGSQAGRRMSNNLFGSGKFQDHTYIRTAHQRRGGLVSPGGRTGAVKHAESNTSISTAASGKAGAAHSTSGYSDSQSLRPVTPDGSAYASSVPSSPNNTTSHIKNGSSEALPGSLSPEVLGRASQALDEVIKELEEEGDDEIVMERLPIGSVPSSVHTADMNHHSSGIPRPQVRLHHMLYTLHMA